MSDNKSDTYWIEALRLLEEAQNARDQAYRIELIRLAAASYVLGGGPPINVDALVAQYSKLPAETVVLQQQQIQPKKLED